MMPTYIFYLIALYMMIWGIIALIQDNPYLAYNLQQNILALIKSLRDKIAELQEALDKKSDMS